MCEPCLKRKSGIRGLENAIKLGKILSNTSKINVQIYTYQQNGVDIYDFEPENNNRELIIEIIKYNGR